MGLGTSAAVTPAPSAISVKPQGAKAQIGPCAGEDQEEDREPGENVEGRIRQRILTPKVHQSDLEGENDHSAGRKKAAEQQGGTKTAQHACEFSASAFVHHHRSGLATNPADCSSTSATWNTVASSRALPIT